MGKKANALIVFFSILISLLFLRVVVGPYIIHETEFKEVVKTVEVQKNETVVITKTENVLIHYTESPKSEGEPTVVVVKDKPKYILGIHFIVDIRLSSTPIVYTPFTGNGIPYIILYYRTMNGTAFNDTGMLHNGNMALQGFYGYDVCNSPFIRFWSFRTQENVPEPAANRSLVYWSEPIPDNLYDIFGNGNNCYSRLHVSTEWIYTACWEGDGVLENPEIYFDEENNVEYRHYDFMDGCISGYTKFSAI